MNNDVDDTEMWLLDPSTTFEDIDRIANEEKYGTNV